LIERAKGILMERHSIDDASAFELLRERSRLDNRKLVDLATAVVDGHRLLPPRALTQLPTLKTDDPSGIDSPSFASFPRRATFPAPEPRLARASSHKPAPTPHRVTTGFHRHIGLAGEARESSLDELRLRCCDVHPVGCEVDMHSSSVSGLVERACNHGAAAHGFTAVWYTPLAAP
jgi:hypothetical protein